jgi:hypothetical protein
MTESAQERRVILAPDLIGAALIDPAARRVFERWLDGEFKVVCNRELLGMHLKVLRDLGLPAELLQRWSYWFTAPQRAVYLDSVSFGKKSPIILCEELAAHAKAASIVCWKGNQGGRWVRSSDFGARDSGNIAPA